MAQWIKYACTQCNTVADVSTGLGTGHIVRMVIMWTLCTLFFIATAMAGSPFAIIWLIFGGIVSWNIRRSAKSRCPACQSADIIPASCPRGQEIMNKAKR